MMPSPVPLPGQQPRPQMAVPAAGSRVLTCCSYICSQGVPAAWECPGCKKVHPAPDAPEAPAR